jgi:hypothetical protein
VAIEFEELNALEQEIWRIGAAQSDTSAELRLVVLIHKSTDYLFVKQNKVTIDATALYAKEENVKLQQVFRTTAWNAHFDGIGQYDINIGMFVVEGFSSSDQMVRATLKNTRHEVTVVKLTEGQTIDVSERMYFEPLIGFGERNGSKVKKIFRERRILSGTYEIAYINNFLLFAIVNPLAIKEFLKTGVVPDGYFESSYYGLDVYCPNWLYYVAERDQFQFCVSLNGDIDSTEDELAARIKTVLDFAFSEIENFSRAEGQQSSLQKIFGCTLEDSWAIWDAFQLWYTTDQEKSIEEEYWDTALNWVRPDIVKVSVENSEVDPSRGTHVRNSTKVDEYSEYFSEWSLMNFEKSQNTAYLLRLKEQSTEIKKTSVDIDQVSYGQIPLEDLNFSLRTYNKLKREGVSTLGELIAFGENELLALKNLGAEGVGEIPQKIAAIGLEHLISASSWPFSED